MITVHFVGKNLDKELKGEQNDKRRNNEKKKRRNIENF